MTILELTVSADAQGQRLDGWALDSFVQIASISQARKLARRGKLTVDHQKARGTQRIRAGATVSLHLDDQPRHRILELEFPVVYDDPHLAIIDKPPGLRVSGNLHRTVVSALPYNLARSCEPDALATPHPVHRLDARTGGLLVIARTARAAMALGHAFQQRKVFKRYRAILVGRLEGTGTTTTPIEDRSAETRYQAVDHTPSGSMGCLTTVDLWPRTGRKHQIRRHMAELGHPVLGDDLYTGDIKNIRGRGLFLRALELRLPHPVHDHEVHAIIDEPDRFAARRQRERHWYEHHCVD